VHALPVVHQRQARLGGAGAKRNVAIHERCKGSLIDFSPLTAVFFSALHVRAELRHCAVILIIIMTSEADKNSWLTVHGLSIDARLKNLEGMDYLPPAAF